MQCTVWIEWAEQQEVDLFQRECRNKNFETAERFKFFKKVSQNQAGLMVQVVPGYQEKTALFYCFIPFVWLTRLTLSSPRSEICSEVFMSNGVLIISILLLVKFNIWFWRYLYSSWRQIQSQRFSAVYEILTYLRVILYSLANTDYPVSFKAEKT
jgi:hypothetical protein